MSRREYIATAAILREADLTPTQRDALAHRFVTMFADENPKFSPSRFLEAALLPEPPIDGSDEHHAASISGR